MYEVQIQVPEGKHVVRYSMTKERVQARIREWADIGVVELEYVDTPGNVYVIPWGRVMMVMVSRVEV